MRQQQRKYYGIIFTIWLIFSNYQGGLVNSKKIVVQISFFFHGNIALYIQQNIIIYKTTTVTKHRGLYALQPPIDRAERSPSGQIREFTKHTKQRL
jgi:hypothetical protein